MKKQLSIIALLLMLPCVAFSQHQRNQQPGNVIHGWNGPHVNQHNNSNFYFRGYQAPPVLYPTQPQSFYFLQPEIVQYVQPQQHVQVCGPVYAVQTPYTIVYKRDCWWEWRY